MIIDTHTHLYLQDFEDPDAAVRRAKDAGVEHMIFPNVDLTTVEPMLALHDRHSDCTSVAMGLHPTEVNEEWSTALGEIERLLSERNDYVAVGEIGIDLYWDKTFRNEQREVFARQIDLALSHDLPIIIHAREGLDDILDVFSSFDRLPSGVFHSFGGTAEDIDRIRSKGDFYFGINGIVTFKNSKVKDVLPIIGTDRLLLETDSPYLAPVPFRGKRNESAYIIHTAAYIADALGTSIEKIAGVTTDNARQLFRIKKHD